MALMFSPGVRNIYASSVFCNAAPNGYVTYLTNTTSTQNSVLIYGGVQPTAAEFMANWATTYRNNALNSQLLACFTQAKWTRTQNRFVMTTFPDATVPVRNGTAAWAVMVGVNPTTANLDDAAWIDRRSFFIAPVTTISGNGVVRFMSLDFSTSSAVTLIDAGFSIL